jgi:hypothetical protein
MDIENKSKIKSEIHRRLECNTQTTFGRIGRCTCFWICLRGKGLYWQQGLQCVSVKGWEGHSWSGSHGGTHPSPPVTIATPHTPNSLQTPISPFIRNCSRARPRDGAVSCTSKCHYNCFKTRGLQSNPWWLTQYIYPTLHLVQPTLYTISPPRYW